MLTVLRPFPYIAATPNAASIYSLYHHFHIPDEIRFISASRQSAMPLWWPSPLPFYAIQIRTSMSSALLDRQPTCRVERISSNFLSLSHWHLLPSSVEGVLWGHSQHFASLVMPMLCLAASTLNTKESTAGLLSLHSTIPHQTLCVLHSNLPLISLEQYSIPVHKEPKLGDVSGRTCHASTTEMEN